ncbi:MAG: hypothetical protein KME55_28945 [Nostoc indistinguendum CM1-VF10]|nr:hypothetical protein [Nostoc indistinguendum CM1-VF10]
MQQNNWLWESTSINYSFLAATWTLYISAYYGWQCNDALPYVKSDRPQPNVQYFTKVYPRNLGVHLPPVKLSEQK